MRQTIVDIARAAGVSTATVDRVLQRARRRPRPHPGTASSPPRARSVICPIGPGAGAPPVRLDFVLPSGPNTFMDLLAAHLASRGARRVPPRSTRARPSRRRVQPGSAGGQPARAAGHQRRYRHHRPRSSPGARSDPRNGGRRHAGPHPGVRHRTCAAPRLCRHRQPQRRAPRRPPARPLRPRVGGRGGAVRGLPQLPRPRGARDGIPPYPGGRVPWPDDRRAARSPRRPRAQLPRGQGNCWRRIRVCAASTISAPATAASPGRCRKPAGTAKWCSSATS